MLTAAELRECSPEYFAALTGQDDVSVTLPLADIVKQLPTEHFARRQQAPGGSAERSWGRCSPPMARAVSIANSARHRPPATPATPAYHAQPAVTTTSAQRPAAPASAPGSKISMSAQALASLKRHRRGLRRRRRGPALLLPREATAPAPATPARLPTGGGRKNLSSGAPKSPATLPFRLASSARNGRRKCARN